MHQSEQHCLTRPLISFNGLQRSARIVRLLGDYYWPLHGLTSADLFTCLPIVNFIAALIYQTDTLSEAEQKNGVSVGDMMSIASRSKQVLLECLQALQLNDAALVHELELGARYLQLEYTLLRMPCPNLELMRDALALRSSDLRLLHRVCLQTLQREPDELLFELIRPLEAMAELRDDLYQYEDDSRSGDFNTYVLLEKCFGAQAQQFLLKERDYYQQQFQHTYKKAPSDLRERVDKAYRDAFDLDTFVPPVPA